MTYLDECVIAGHMLGGDLTNEEMKLIETYKRAKFVDVVYTRCSINAASWRNTPSKGDLEELFDRLRAAWEKENKS